MKNWCFMHIRRIVGALLVVAAFSITSAQDASAKIRIAFPDVATVEYTHFLAALGRARAKGVEIDITYFTKEELASLAVVKCTAVAAIEDHNLAFTAAPIHCFK